MFSRARFRKIKPGTWAIRPPLRGRGYRGEKPGQVALAEPPLWQTGGHGCWQEVVSRPQRQQKTDVSSGLSREMKPRRGERHVGRRRGKGSSPDERHREELLFQLESKGKRKSEAD